MDNNNFNSNDEYYNEVENNSVKYSYNDRNYNEFQDVNYSYNNMNILNSPIIKKFNWGAFIDPVFWGIGNKAYLGLLTLIPFFGFIWRFICGFKGNEWAWEAGNYSSLEDFDKVQSTWNRAGIARFIAAAISIVLFTIFYIVVIVAAIGSYNYWNI